MPIGHFQKNVNKVLQTLSNLLTSALQNTKMVIKYQN